jgi:DNA-directed RNA polymerase alpha subunit
MEVSDLNLTVRAFNFLKKANILTTEEFFNLTEEDLVRLKCGRKTTDEIKSYLKENNSK